MNRFVVNRVVYIVGHGGSSAAVAGLSNKLFVEQVFWGQTVHVVFLFICQAVFDNFMYFAIS